MIYSDASKKYRQTTEITSTRKTKQVVMLYDGIIKFLTEVKQGIEENDVQKRFNGTDKAGKIVDGLHSCLDPENGKEITTMLDNFYGAIFVRIMNINFEKDKELNHKNCCQLIEEVKLMRDAWQEVDEQSVKGQTDSSSLENAFANKKPGDDSSDGKGISA